MLAKEQHREYRDRERDRGFSRSCKYQNYSDHMHQHFLFQQNNNKTNVFCFPLTFSAYAKHSSSRNSRLRWHDSDNVQTHRRRPEGSFLRNPFPAENSKLIFNQFSKAESQENMEISGGDSTPTSEASYSHSSTPNAQAQHIADGPVLLANARLASHPPTPNNSQMNISSSCTPSSSSGEF